MVGFINNIIEYFKPLDVKIDRELYEKRYNTGIRFRHILYLYHLYLITPILCFLIPLLVFLFIISLDISFLLPISILLFLMVMVITILPIIIHIEQRRECLTLINGDEIRIVSKVDSLIPYTDVTFPIRNIKYIGENNEKEGKARGINLWKRKRSKIKPSDGHIYPIYSEKVDLVSIELTEPLEIKVFNEKNIFSKPVKTLIKKLVFNVCSKDHNDLFQTINERSLITKYQVLKEYEQFE